jgi:hypothetical protein
MGLPNDRRGQHLRSDTMTYERLDYGSPDGCQIGGAATDKIGFYGKTPAVQPASIAAATDAATAISQANLVIAALKTLGLVAT